MPVEPVFASTEPTTGRYVREWNYRFNRRKRIFDLADFVLNAMTRPTIT